MDTLNTQSKQEPRYLPHDASEIIFKPCPFCGNHVNVFEVPETRYGKNAPFGWTLECVNMGCIFTCNAVDQSLSHLAENWNKRV